MLPMRIDECEHLGAASIAIGVFDGVHRGHRELIEALVRDARAHGCKAVVVSFDPDPDVVVSPSPAQKLMTADRLHALAQTGVDAVVAVPLRLRLRHSTMSVFSHCCHAWSTFVRFALAAILGWVVAVLLVLPRCASGVPSTALTCMVTICFASAARPFAPPASVMSWDRAMWSWLLVRPPPYMLRGGVIRGRHEGSGMGFPTANLQVPDGIQVPADGVYEGLVLVDDTVWPAAVNVGLPPTYADDAASSHLEANLIGYTGDLYGASVSLAFTRWLRPSRVFDSLDELIATVEGNIEDIRHNLGEQGVSIRD